METANSHPHGAKPRLAVASGIPRIRPCTFPSPPWTDASSSSERRAKSPAGFGWTYLCGFWGGGGWRANLNL